MSHRYRQPSTWRLLLLVPLVVGLLPRLLPAGLEQDVRPILQDRLLAKAVVGIEVIRLAPGEAQPLLRHNAEQPLIPASNLKLLTSSAFLNRMGPDFKFRTLLLQRGEDVAIVGDGDPTFGDHELLKKVGWDVSTVYANWAELLKKRGLAQVRNVFVDDSVFDEVFFHPNWPIDQENRRYCAQVGGVNLNANCVDFYLRRGASGQIVDYVTNPATKYLSVTNKCVSGGENRIGLVRVGGTNNVTLYGETNANNTEPVSVSVHDPGLFAATVLAETLDARGVKVTGTAARDRTIRPSLAAGAAPTTQPGWTVLAIHETPLETVLARCNKDSMNLYAEALCKRLGFETSGEGSWKAGTEALASYAEKVAGVTGSELVLDDGCGLSKQNRISANVLARVLSADFTGPNRDVFLKSLAVAGVDGTLDDRFRGTDLRGRVFAKSGYVNGVSSLSGYLMTRDEQWFAFSLLFNGIPQGSNYGAKQLQERIVRAIDDNAHGDNAHGDNAADRTAEGTAAPATAESAGAR